VNKTADKTGPPVLWFLRPAPPVELFKFCLGLKCFSDTSVDISFDFVNALKMPPASFAECPCPASHESRHRKEAYRRTLMQYFTFSTTADSMDVDEVRPRKDKRGVDLISNRTVLKSGG
jgi:hypothetical protein